MQARSRSTETIQAEIYVAEGHGLRIGVERGHLVVEDGLGGQLRRARFNRATSGLRRLIVLGHTGSVSLEALRWLADVRAAFVHIDSDGNLLTASAPARHHEGALRRAQVLAAESRVGRQIIVQLLRSKLERQAENVESLAHLRETITVDGRDVSVAEAIRQLAGQLDPELPIRRLRVIESIAGRHYWETWARVPIAFSPDCVDEVPDHWRLAGPRTSRVDGKWPRRAVTPAHAMLNYAYAVLEVEASLACQAVGLDPALGVMHADARYRGSMAADLMEPSRPLVDRVVLSLLTTRVHEPGLFRETRDGRCRLDPSLARELAAETNCFSSARDDADAVRAALLANGGSASTAPPRRARGRYRSRR